MLSFEMTIHRSGRVSPEGLPRHRRLLCIERAMSERSSGVGRNRLEYKESFRADTVRTVPGLNSSTNQYCNGNGLAQLHYRNTFAGPDEFVKPAFFRKHAGSAKKPLNLHHFTLQSLRPAEDFCFCEAISSAAEQTRGLSRAGTRRQGRRRAPAEPAGAR